jgi:hypothetical protein
MPDRMPEDMSDRMPEDLPVRKCINVMVGIIRSEVILLFFNYIIVFFLYYIIIYYIILLYIHAMGQNHHQFFHRLKESTWSPTQVILGITYPPPVSLNMASSKIQ